jgi:single-strand DNA-binding protein
MNKVIQTLRLCADPEIKTYGDDKQLVSFRGAVNKRFKKDGEPDADFFQYTAFGKTAEFISKYFKKGDPMLIEGEINNNNYTKEDGTKVYGTQIVVNNVEFFGKKSEDSGSGSSESTSSGAETKKTETKSSAATSSYDEFDDDF